MEWGAVVTTYGGRQDDVGLGGRLGDRPGEWRGRGGRGKDGLEDEVKFPLQYWSEQLLFVEDLSIAKQADYTISGQLTESAIDELMAAGKYRELFEELIKNMHESS